MTEHHHDIDQISGTATTGHAWDGIKELNTPLPRWWVWTFYATILWSIGYWIVYPAWPLVTGYTKGVFNYSTRADVAVELANLEKIRGAKMVALGEEKLRDYIKTIGLYRNKAKNVIALSKRLIDEFDGQVPGDRDVLETLPGVGRKTANVVMNVAFGHPTMAVDTHVFRVANRVGLSRGTTPLAVEADLLRVVPPEYALHAHHWLILHGRYICKARRPECWRCLINDICLYPDKTPAP